MMNLRTMTGASNLFTPDDITSLEAWYDASDITTITKDGSNLVSAWTDKSTNGYDLSASGTARPTWVDADLNNRAVLDFDGSANTFAIHSGLYSIPNGSNTIFCVCNTDNSTALQVVLGMAEAGSTRLDLRYPVASGAAYYQSRNVNSGGVSIAGISDTSYGIVMGRRSGTTQAIAYNGGTESTNSNGANENGIDSGYIGSFGNTAYYFDGQMAEMLIFSTSLSSSDISRVNSYLAYKWGISI